MCEVHLHVHAANKHQTPAIGIRNRTETAASCSVGRWLEIGGIVVFVSFHQPSAISIYHYSATITITIIHDSLLCSCSSASIKPRLAQLESQLQLQGGVYIKKKIRHSMLLYMMRHETKTKKRNEHKQANKNK
jgi:hypothetical protein